MFFALFTAAWLGILTSISPCPLATNIAAISFIGKRLSSTRQVLLASASYVIGRTLAYLIVAAIVVAGLLSIPGVSQFLQKYMNRLLGPVLILAGVFLLEWIRFVIPGLSAGSGLQARAEKGGLWGPLLLGVVFALSFCPVSAALFFGSLIPLSVQHGSPVLMPVVYGIGTALPVVVFAVLIAVGAQQVGKAFDRLTAFEKWARRITGVIFLLAGVYLILSYWFGWDAFSLFYQAK
ncbi:sulfite exporter TauE/SafE family protein [bacterium]|nr:sulfite exporter TauE/SafE family protein [bacterium]MBU1983105.1 sulfite exporter TauE/SafE family protein [bacterium]